MKKIVGTMIIVVILFLYLPVHSADYCEESGHGKSMKMDCGYSFHCPLAIRSNLSELLPTPWIGQLDLISSLPIIDELIHLIFRPPEY